MDPLEKIFNEVDIPIDGNVLAEMDFGDISNSQWNESFESISENNFKCKDCKKVYSQQQSLNRHINTFHSVSSYICAVCKRTFNRMDNLRRHQSTAHGRSFVQKKKLLLLLQKVHLELECTPILRRKMSLLHPILQMMRRILDPSNFLILLERKSSIASSVEKCSIKETVLIYM
ncbi:hypothetical protein TNCV_680091 [Trichonephila clavipes]|nr:hypothetical protein TNCV_680091 [Trichonephila clavipes]